MSEACKSCTEFFGGDHFATGEAFTHTLDVDLVSGMCQQARLAEQNRIVRALEAHRDTLADIETGHASSSANTSIRVKTIDAIIALIKGEK